MIHVRNCLTLSFLMALFISVLVNAETPAEGSDVDESVAAVNGEIKEGAVKEIIEDQAYQKLVTRMNTLEGSIKDTKGQIRAMIHLSKSSGNAAVGEAGATVSSEIQRLQKQLKSQTSDYNEKRLELKYRYPSQGVILDRRYLPMGNKSLEEIESEVGLEGNLSRIKAVIMRKYKEFMPSDEAEAHALEEKKNHEKKRNKKLRLEQ